MKKQFLCLLACIYSIAAFAGGPGRFRFQAAWGPYNVIVAESDSEPFSIGTYTIRVYDGRFNEKFVDGLFVHRDGGMVKAWIADIQGGPDPELIVWCRCAGSGAYGDIDVFRVDDDRKIRRVPVNDLTYPYEGYSGRDEFDIRNGTLHRTFPLYRPDDSNCCPTGGKEHLRYHFSTGKWVPEE